ncbi:MAG: hypothetical protein ACOC1K_00135 [Nanoarchaeota archaeon]
MNCIVTIPKTIKWKDYINEINDAKDKNLSLYYRLPYKPKKLNIGDRFYICHDGYIKGYMIVKNILFKDTFRCETTGKIWKKGYYIERKGEFYDIEYKPMKGFMGLRYL